MNWMELVSLLARFALITAFLLFLFFSPALRLKKKRQLSKRIVSLLGGEVGLSERAGGYGDRCRRGPYLHPRGLS